MLTHEIRKPEVLRRPGYDHYRGPQGMAHLGNHWQQHRMQQQQQQREHGRPPLPVIAPPVTRGESQYMAKIEYAKWVESDRVRKFKVGRMCTIASEVYAPGRLPSVVLLVDHIQEIHFMAPIDETTDEPKCVGVKQGMFAQPLMYPPCRLRPLNLEEERLVNLRDQEARTKDVAHGGAQGEGQSQREATQEAERSDGEIETAILGGSVVKIDRRTGVIIDDPDENSGYTG